MTLIIRSSVSGICILVCVYRQCVSLTFVTVSRRNIHLSQEGHRAIQVLLLTLGRLAVTIRRSARERSKHKASRWSTPTTQAGNLPANICQEFSTTRSSSSTALALLFSYSTQPLQQPQRCQRFEIGIRAFSTASWTNFAADLPFYHIGLPCSGYSNRPWRAPRRMPSFAGGGQHV